MNVNGLFHGRVALSPGKESPDIHFQGVWVGPGGEVGGQIPVSAKKII